MKDGGRRWNEDRNGPTTPRGKGGTGREYQKTTVHRWWMELGVSIGAELIVAFFNNLVRS